eukprot:g6807.t1
MIQIRPTPIRYLSSPRPTRLLVNCYGLFPSSSIDLTYRSLIPFRRRLPTAELSCCAPSISLSRSLVCRATTQTEDNTVLEITTEAEEDNSFFGKLRRLLRDVGMGRRSFWEGGVGAFLVIGAGICVWLVTWVKGTQLRQGKPYTVTFTFPQASGITVGTPVRIRGVRIGGAIQVKPKLEAVEVKVEVHDHSVVIPKNSIIEANQSGLISEPFIDITPQVPIPQNQYGPLDMDCAEEGLVACNGSTLKGEQGVCLDDLVYMCTKLARQFDQQGVDGFFKAAESVSAALDTAQPLIDRSSQLVEELTPLLNELRSGGLVQDVESLSKSIALAASHAEELQRAILDHDNVEALRESVKTLTSTLKSVERMASDASVFTGDRRVMSSLKRLIEAMSRMMED